MESPEKPGIALDYDGVIADTNSVKSRWIRRHLRWDVPPWETDRTYCARHIGIGTYLRMAPEAYGWRASLAARAVPGARRALRALVDDDERHFIGVDDPGVLRILFKNGARGRVKVPRGARLFTRWADLLPWLIGRLTRR